MISSEGIARVKNDVLDLNRQLNLTALPAEERIVIRQQIIAKDQQLTEMYKLSRPTTGIYVALLCFPFLLYIV